MQPSALIIGLSGLRLTAREREQLQHPWVGGVILFARNYASPSQLTQLSQEIHATRPGLLLGVDQEGGRVQRFREGFSALPAAIDIGRAYDRSPVEGLQQAAQAATTMATELARCGVNLCFAPVADLYHAESRVIASRAFHADPDTAGLLAVRFAQAMQEQGIMAVAKHFPGHGSVLGDTHVEQVVDSRSWAEIETHDLIPFKRLIAAGVPGVMPAHVVYPAVDSKPGGFSKIWLQEILRRQLGFQGLIFSDDLGMQAAKATGSPLVLIEQALAAGCDRVLLCNELEVIAGILERRS